MENLNELFRKVTSLVVDVESAIENSEDKEMTFRHLIWHIPNGVKWKNHPEMSKDTADLMNALAEACGVNAEEIYNEGGIIDYREELALSSAEVEIDPTEEPGVDEPEIDPTDKPEDITTETPEVDESEDNVTGDDEEISKE